MRPLLCLLILLFSSHTLFAQTVESYLQNIKETRRLSPIHIKKLSNLLKNEEQAFSHLFLNANLSSFHKRLLISSLLQDQSKEKSIETFIDVMKKIKAEEKESINLLNYGLNSIYNKAYQSQIFASINKNVKTEIVFRATLIQNSNKDVLNFYLKFWKSKKPTKKILAEIVPSFFTTENFTFINNLLKSKNPYIVQLAKRCLEDKPQLKRLFENRNNNTSPERVKITNKEKALIEKKIVMLVPLFKKLKKYKGTKLLMEQASIFEQYTKGINIEEQLLDHLDLSDPFQKKMYWLCHFRVDPFDAKKYYKTLLQLNDADKHLRSTAILQLKEAKDQKLLFTFYRLLDDPFPQVREDALDSIYLLAEETSGFVLKTNSRRIYNFLNKREDRRIEPTSSANEIIKQKIVSMLEDSDADVIIGAIQVLVSIRHRSSYPAIVQLAYHENKSVKLAVCDAIAQRSIKTANKELGILLNDPLWEIRGRAARVFWEFGIHSVKEAELLFASLQKETDEYVIGELTKSLNKATGEPMRKVFKTIQTNIETLKKEISTLKRKIKTLKKFIKKAPKKIKDLQNIQLAKDEKTILILKKRLAKMKKFKDELF